MAESGRQWGGRFVAGMNELTQSYTAAADQGLYELDIKGSIAHARMLGAVGIISEEDASAIIRGLEEVCEEFRSGSVEWRPELEDVHTHVEWLLRRRIGETAGRLHTARSRNDQVALLNRMLVRQSCDEAADACAALVEVLAGMAEGYAGAPMPGYTHLQRAQPVTLGHHLLAYGEMFLRDRERFLDCRRRANRMPLGSGALAGSPYPLDRGMVAAELGFEGVTRNSIDATADRDFVAEYAAACAIAQVHLSRLAEEIVLWASSEFGYLVLPDEFATGSSMMPQKKNPDVAELARGRAGRAVGSLVAILTTLKGLPLAYNRDLQEDKNAILEATSIVVPSLRIFGAMLPRLEFRLDRMAAAAGEGFSLATDVADYLVRKGVPFREAHAVVGRLVRACEERGCELADLPLEVYRAESPLFDEDVLSISLESALAARSLVGGTAPKQVREAAEALRRDLRRGEKDASR